MTITRGRAWAKAVERFEADEARALLFAEHYGILRAAFNYGWECGRIQDGSDTNETDDDNETSSAEAQPIINFKIGDRVRTTGLIPDLEGHIVGVGSVSYTIDVPGWGEVTVPQRDVEAA